MNARAALAVLLLCCAKVARADAPEELERLALDATRGIVPQLPRAAELFRRARPVEAEAFQGMLLCEIAVQGERWDGGDPIGPVRRSLGRAEIDADFGLPGREDRVRYRGPDDQNRVVVSIPGVRLVRDDEMLVTLVDRDVLSNDAIGRLTLTYGGSLPMQASIPEATVECRAAPRTVIDDSVEAALRSVDDAIADLDREGRPNRQLLSFREPGADPSSAWRALYALAAYVGYADPRFLQHRDVLRARDVAHVAAVQQLVRALVDAAPESDRYVRIEGTRLSLRVDRYDCELGSMLLLHPEVGLDVPMECALHVSVRNAGDGDATLSATLHAVDDLGATEALPRAVFVRDETLERARALRFPPGESHLLLPAPTRHAVLLRVGVRRSVVWVRLPAPALDEGAVPMPTRAPTRAP